MFFSKKAPAGFTITELVIGISVGSILFLAFMAVMTNHFVIMTKSNAQIDMAANAQNLLRATVDTLRVGNGVRQTNTISDSHAPSGGWNTSNTAFVIVIAAPAFNSSHDYITDPDTGSPYMNELVYYKSGTTLMERQLANPEATGNTLLTSCPTNQTTPSCPADKILAENVQAMNFVLYDQDNNSTADPSLARLIQIDLNMQRSVFGSQIALSNSIRVTLRNRF